MRINQTVPRSTLAPAATSITPSLLTILRVGAAACFIGHGAFGVLGKDAWLPFFATFGIGADAARVLMPVIGAVESSACWCWCGRGPSTWCTWPCGPSGRRRCGPSPGRAGGKWWSAPATTASPSPCC